ncbi:MAG TPA: hypothetical protein VLC46_10710 [Thermoanaerobaculia bacterium]|jgi:hypothetical protein|nr:hypothetical protein [Thermoanaerobaculia bacterium]
MRGRRSIICVIIALSLVSITASGQESAKKRFGNADVIALIKAGLGDSVVTAKINQAPDVEFNLETDDLVRLKNGGASPAVISAMLARVSPQIESAPRPRPDPAAVAARRQSGTAVLVTKDGRKEIARSAGEFSTTGFSFVKFTFLNYPGLGAKVRTGDLRPSVLLNSEFDPREHFFIVKLDVDTKINARSLKVEGKSRGFSESAGIMPASHWIVDYTSHEDEEGVWRITPISDLELGEYGVFDGMFLYGFGIGEAAKMR